LVAGVDGCRAGWVIVTCQGRRVVNVSAVADLQTLVEQIDSGTLQVAAIDIPIGLAEKDRRESDREARKRLGARRSSVFPAPVRAVLAAMSYEEACAISRATSGRAISKQLFNILPKIREVDALVTPERQRHLVEMSPELSLALLGGAPMAHSKLSAAGRTERLRVLGAYFGRDGVERAATHPPATAKADDVLDAFAGAWTAWRVAAGEHLHLGGERDGRGLRMEMVA
jgi:predicted RNase H-like nuclease